MARMTPIEVSENRDGTFELRLPGETQPRRLGEIATVWAALDEIDAPHRPLLERLTGHALAAVWRVLRSMIGIARVGETLWDVASTRSISRANLQPGHRPPPAASEARLGCARDAR